jgi:hypothetical protein
MKLSQIAADAGKVPVASRTFLTPLLKVHIPAL